MALTLLGGLAAFLLDREIKQDTDYRSVILEPVAPTLPPVIIQVDNVDCVISEEPTLTYYAATDTVRLNIECDSGILFHYLPAVLNSDVPEI